MKLLYDVDNKLYLVEFGEKSTKLTFRTEGDARRYMNLISLDEDLVKRNVGGYTQSTARIEDLFATK